MAALVVDVANEAGTEELAGDIAAVIGSGDVIALHGDLGMGKSALARAILRSMADDADLEVPSPTFTLVQVYETSRLTLAHFDLYRIADPDELDQLDFDALTTTGAALIEWPDRAGDRLPASALHILIEDGAQSGARRFSLQGPGGWMVRLERSFKARALLTRSGFAGANRRHLQGDASTKSWERVQAGDQRAVLMSWPVRPQGPALADGRSYEEAAEIASGPLSVIAITTGLRARGIRAAKVLGEDIAARLALFEDLGDDKIVDATGRPIPERYLEASRFLARLVAKDWPDHIDLADGRRSIVPRYSPAVLQTEVDLFPNWYLPEITGAPVTGQAMAEWTALWAPLLQNLSPQKSVWCLRDFHSPNILWQSDGGDPIGVIDLQDSLLGPPAYDLASLVTDARVDLPPGLAAAMLTAYIDERRLLEPAFDAARFRDEVTILNAQRNAKILGRFQEYYRRLGRTAHLKYMPRVKANFVAQLSEPVLAGLRLWYDTHVRPFESSGPS